MNNIEKIELFLAEIVELIAYFGNVDIESAREMSEKFWEQSSNSKSDPFLLTETPYFYSMSILHHPQIGDNLPQWYLDPKYMPPPSWITEKYYHAFDK